MINAYKRYWTNFLNFSGIASRAEYWWPVIINSIIGGILIASIQAITGHPIDEIYNLFDVSVSLDSKVISFLIWFANLSVTFRRLHDTNRSAWWILIRIIPIIGTVWFFILTVLPSKPSRWS